MILILDKVHKMLSESTLVTSHLISRSEATFCRKAGSFKEVKLIRCTEYDEILDGMTHQTLAERVDQFIQGIISILK